MEIGLSLSLVGPRGVLFAPGELNGFSPILLTTGATIEIQRLLEANPSMSVTTAAELCGVGCFHSDVDLVMSTTGDLNTGFLFDNDPALIGYSLRRLSVSSTVSIRVRRSSDNAEQDIGFSGQGLDTATLESFCGAGDGFITKWYNQGTGVGTSYDAVQASASNQPQIVSSGTTITDNGKPAFDFSTGGERYLRTGTITTINTPVTYFFVARAGTHAGDNQIPMGGTGVDNRHMYYVRSTGNWALFGGGAVAENGAANTNQHIFSALISSGAASNAWLDGSQIITNQNVGADPMVGYTIGSYYLAPTATNSWKGKIQEWIAYDANETSNRTTIEADLNDYYGVV